jgi:hypothetical protein
MGVYSITEAKDRLSSLVKHAVDIIRRMRDGEWD